MEEESGERTGQPSLAGKIRQDNKLMMMTMIGVDNLEEHLRQKRLRWFEHIARRDEEVEIKKVFELKIEGRRKRGRPVK